MKKDGLRCVCGKIAKPTKMKFLGHSIRGWKCPCGEAYHDPRDSQPILLMNKLKDKKFEIKVGKIRSNLIVRIPKEISDLLGINSGDKITINAKPDRIELIL